MGPIASARVDACSVSLRRKDWPTVLPGFNIMMFGFGSASVILKQLEKIGRGGAQSANEICLMFAEKAAASSEAMTALMFGGTFAGTVAHFREHVAANEARLSAA